MQSKCKNIMGCLAVMAILSSCQKDLDYFQPDPGAGPDTAWVATPSNSMAVGRIMDDIRRQPETDSFQISLGATTTAITASGLTFLFTVGTLVNDSNQVVTGTVTLESMLLRKKGDYIRMGVSSDNILLSNEAAIFTRFTQYQRELSVRNGSSLRFSFPEPQPRQGLSMYEGTSFSSFRHHWNPLTDSLLNSIYPANQSYQVGTNKTGWVAAGTVLNPGSSGEVSLSVALPSNYTNANSLVYLVSEQMPLVQALQGDQAQRRFRSGLLPVNQSIRLIVLSKQDNIYFMGTQTVITQPSSTGVQQVNIIPVISSLQQVNAMLDGL
ncbi:MAG TPA: hypothetical protein PKW54_08725 [Ferruginibacter sp.]|nr:hypothetical protein [Ferruginibacter sp.]